MFGGLTTAQKNQVCFRIVGEVVVDPLWIRNTGQKVARRSTSASPLPTKVNYVQKNQPPALPVA